MLSFTIKQGKEFIRQKSQNWTKYVSSVQAPRLAGMKPKRKPDRPIYYYEYCKANVKLQNRKQKEKVRDVIEWAS